MATPTLKRSWFFAGIDGNRTDTADTLKVSLEAGGPSPVASGDLLLVTLAFHNGLTATVSGDVSGSFTSAISVANTGLTTPRKYQIFWVLATGNDTTLTLGYGGQTTDLQLAVSLWYNVATSTPIDGAGIATTGIVPVNNTAPNIQPGSFSFTTGDLIYNVVFDESNGTIGVPNAWNGVTFGSGFSGLGTETFYGLAAQYQVVAGTSLNPGITVSQTTHDSFASLAIAIKPGAGGSAPSAGIRIVRSQMAPIQSVAQTTAVPFPSTGNLIVVCNDAGTFGSSLTSVTDGTNTYTAIASTPAGFPQCYHADNATTSNTLVVSLVTTTASGNDLVAIYDIAGAATSPLDTAATAANASVLTAAGSGATKNSGTQTLAGDAITDAPSIVPSTSNGLIITSGNFGTGPVGSLSAPSGSYDYVPATWGGTAPTGDNNYLGNGDFMAHYFNPTTATVNFGYAVPNTVAASWQAIAMAFKAAVSFAAGDDNWLVTLPGPSDPIVSVW